MRYSWLLLIVSLLALGSVLGQDRAIDRVLLLDVRGPIGPALSDFVARGIQRAGDEGAEAIILHIDTPGGLDTAMRDIIKAILSAPVPVVAYVAPGGARAASAGTFILYASHVAAMAPATNLGAATPIPIGPGMLPGDGKRRPKDADDEAAEEPAATPEAAMQRKVLNDAIAYIRSLAELHDRNADWAEEAVRSGASLSAEAALEQRVIDLVAQDIADLVEQLDGREVQVLGEKRTLNTKGWQVQRVEPDWKTEILSVITNPNVAYILLLLGVYGLLFELYSPGAIIPGIVGAISLVLALYALHLLPVNYAGLALILMGVVMISIELFTPSFGALGVGGVVALVAGSVMLFDTDVEGVTVSLPLILTVGVSASALFLATILVAVRQRKRPVVTGREEMIGDAAQALEPFTDTGRVLAHGEMWTARTATPVSHGQRLRITGIDGLTLEVEPLEEEESQ